MEPDNQDQVEQSRMGSDPAKWEHQRPVYQSAQPYPKVKPKRSKKIWAFLIIGIVLISVLVYGFSSLAVQRKLTKLQAEHNAQREVINSNYKDGKPETVKTLEEDEIKNWATYIDPAGFFEFRYPADWSLILDSNICSPRVLVPGEESKLSGSCVVESNGQVVVEALKGQLLRSRYEIEDPAFTDIQTDSYFIDGVASFKELGTKIKTEKVYPDIAVGDQILIYIFQKDGYTYVARCTLSDKNVSKTVQRDFETMVYKTFKFKE